MSALLTHLFTDHERVIFRALALLAVGNPFFEQRIELERLIVGDQLVNPGRFMSPGADPRKTHENVARITALVHLRRAVLRCPRCAEYARGRHLTQPDVARKILDHLGVRSSPHSALWVLWSSGVVARMFPDTGEDDTPELPPMVALASDDAGAVAMICFEKHLAYTTRDGMTLAYRSLVFPQDWYDALPDPVEDPFHVAVAGGAVAFSIGWRGAFLTRDVQGKPFELCEALGPAGALAFEGSSPDAALFGAPHTEGFTSIVRVDAAGSAMRIGQLHVEPGPAVPFDELAWDGSRRRLFAVHRQVGLVVATAPDAKGKKRPAAN